jgi:hypothetical protein
MNIIAVHTPTQVLSQIRKERQEKKKAHQKLDKRMRNKEKNQKEIKR